MMQLGKYVERLILLNEDNHNFRIFGPDEALSNRLNHIFDATKDNGKERFLIVMNIFLIVVELLIHIYQNMYVKDG